nr:hypothetical protein [Aeromonas salmonicida]
MLLLQPLSAFWLHQKTVGAVQANKILGDLHYPQLSSMLPYRFYDADSGYT